MSTRTQKCSASVSPTLTDAGMLHGTTSDVRPLAGTDNGPGSGRLGQSPAVTVKGSQRTWIWELVAGSEPRLCTVILIWLGMPLAAPGTAAPNGPTSSMSGLLKFPFPGAGRTCS